MSALAAALLAAQKEMPRLHKDSTADTGKFSYKYLSLETLLAAVLPVLNKHGLYLWQGPEVLFGANENGSYKLPALRTTIVHDTGEHIESVMPLALGGEYTAQAQGSAITYARRYALLSMLALAPDEDDDGAAAQKAPAQAEKPAETVEGPSPAQHARLAIMLKELEEKHPKDEGVQTYTEDARDWIKAKFGKHSRSQLSITEMGDLIEEVERWAGVAEIPFGEPAHA